MSGPRVIGILGVAGSGKTLVSKHLSEQHGYTRMRFADPIKRMLKALGLTDEQLDGDAKMTGLPQFGGATPRAMMQSLGTEWGRRQVYGDIWINVLRAEAMRCTTPLVVDDVRFPNEATLIKDMGGVLWRVYRPGLNTMDHASERAQRAILEDVLINNATSIPALYSSVDHLLTLPATAEEPLVLAS